MNHKPKILVADDEKMNIVLIEATLLPLGYDIISACNGEKALQKAREKLPDLILMDVMMPKVNGFEVARQLKADEKTNIIPIVMVTSLREVEDRVKALKAGADDFLSKPVDSTELRARVKSLLKVKAYNDHVRNYQKELEKEVTLKTKELVEAITKVKQASLDTIYRLAKATDYKDEGTGNHLKRISNYAAAIAHQMKLGNVFIESILYATPMHDIGKISTPDHILLKQGKLDDQEWEIMKQHTTVGAKILEGSDSELIKMAQIIALTHHEKWDGNGYPKGLKGNKIPLSGRITAVADVFDALTSKRPYRAALPIDEAFKIIKEGRGKHFDPEVVDAFLAARNEIVSIQTKYVNGVQKLDNVNH